MPPALRQQRQPPGAARSAWRRSCGNRPELAHSVGARTLKHVAEPRDKFGARDPSCHRLRLPVEARVLDNARTGRRQAPSTAPRQSAPAHDTSTGGFVARASPTRVEHSRRRAGSSGAHEGKAVVRSRFVRLPRLEWHTPHLPCAEHKARRRRPPGTADRERLTRASRRSCQEQCPRLHDPVLADCSPALA